MILNQVILGLMIIYNMAENKIFNILEGIEKGMGPSIYTGFQDIRNIDISSTGSVQIKLKQVQASMTPIANIPFTADTGTNQIYHPTSTRDSANNKVTNDGRAVTFATTGTLPAPLVAGTVYWLKWQGAGYSKIYPTYPDFDNSSNVITLTDTGTGVHTMTSINMATPNSYVSGENYSFVQDTTGRVWVLDDYGRVFLLSDKDGNRPSTTSASGNGLAIFKKYLIIFRNSKIDVIGPITNSSENWVLTTDWQSINPGGSNANGFHCPIVGQDDILYYTSYVSAFSTNPTPGNIGSIAQVTGETFTPGTPATFNHNLEALDLGEGIQPTTLTELGKYLVIGTNKGLYSWDRVSASFDIILFKDKKIRSQASDGTTAYIFVGESCDLYATNLSSSTLLKKLPPYLFTNNLDRTATMYPLGCDIVGGKLFYALNTNLSGEKTKVYSYELNTGVFKIENTDSTAVGDIRLVRNYGDNWYWSGKLNGLDFTHVTEYRTYTNYEAQLITPFFTVGDSLTPKTFTSLQIINAKQFSESGQNIRIYYRTTTNGSWTLLYTTENITNLTHTQYIESGINLTVKTVQFKVTMTNSATASANTNNVYDSPIIKAITLK